MRPMTPQLHTMAANVRTALRTGTLLLAAGALVGAAGCGVEEGAEAAGSASATVFEGARIITGQESPPIEDGVLVVEGDRFTQVGARDEVDAPEGAARVDLSGRTVMPAIVNAHMHLSSDRDERIQQLRHNAYYGAGVVTSLGMDVGEAPFELRDDPVPGAAIGLTAGRGITRPEPGRPEAPFWVDTPEEAREAVRELAEDGVDLVKIWVDDRGGQYEKMTPELYEAVIDEAHAHDLKVTAHINALEDAKGLLRAGVDAFAHSVQDQAVDDEFLELVREREDFVYVPNLPPSGIDTDLSWLSGTIPAAQIEEMQNQSPSTERYEIQGGNLGPIYEAGVTIGFGTDGGSPFAAHLEMEDMVAAGMPPEDVIVAATRNSARLLGLEDHGTIEPGKSADFVVLEANPLDDITNTRRIEAVYLRGDEVDREAISQELLAVADDG